MILMLLACSAKPRPIYICDPLPLPVPPILLPVKPEQLTCLSDDAYERLVLNRSFAHGYAKKLSGIIALHNKGCVQ
jgi:hypothetical protein